MSRSRTRLSAGAPSPIGAKWDGKGTNFALFSASAERVELCLFEASGGREIERIALPERTEDIWHGYLDNIGPGQRFLPAPGFPDSAADPFVCSSAYQLLWDDESRRP